MALLGLSRGNRLVAALAMFHFVSGLPFSEQHDSRDVMRRTADVDTEMTIFKLLSASTGRYVSVDSNGTLTADNSREDSTQFKAHRSGSIIAIECLGSANQSFVTLRDGTFKCMVASTGLNFTVNYETALSALQEVSGGCYMAFDPTTSAIMPNYCQLAYIECPANAQVYLDGDTN